SDAFEVVFGCPPVLKGKLWPRAEVINPRCFGNSCQPQTQVSSWWPPCCSGGSILPWKGRPTALRDRAGCERRHSLVSFGGRNRKAGKDHQAVAAWQVLQGVHLLTPSATQRSSPAQKEGHVGTEARRQLEARRRIQAVPGEAFESQDRSCGVAASAPEAAYKRNP